MAIKDDRGAASRRGFLGASVWGATAGAFFSRNAAAAPQTSVSPQDDARTLARLERGNSDPSRRILIQGGVIVSMDAKTGNFARGDVLIEGTKIREIGPDLSAAARDGKATIVDARDTIVMPGFVDPHIHAWEGQLSGIIPNSNVVPTDARHNYFTVMHQTLGPHYRAEDMYTGNLITALACLDAGITCFCDNSHNSRSKAHADAAVQALFDSGIRAVYAGGGIRFPMDQPWEGQWPEDLRRLKRERFSSDDQLVTMRMLMAGSTDEKNFRVARDLDLWISWDGGAASPLLPQLYRDGLLVGKESFNHGVGVPEANWPLIREHNAKLNVCPRSDSQFAYGGAAKGYNGILDALEHGIRPGLSNDNAAAYGIDMFQEMQVTYHTQHSIAQLTKFNGGKPPAAVTARDVIEFATIRGAECCALDSKVGSLTPGKEADIVLFRTGNVRHMTMNNAFGAILQTGSIANIDTVFVAGQAKKWRGRMTGKLANQDFEALRKRAEQSRDYILAQANWKFDIFSE